MTTLKLRLLTYTKHRSLRDLATWLLYAASNPPLLIFNNNN